ARAGTAEAGRRMAAALWGPDVEGRALVVPMVAADELVGALALRLPAERRIDAEQREIAGSIANQAAVAIKKVQLIDRLTERNAIKDLLEDLSHGTATASELEQRAESLGCDLSTAHLVLQAAPRPGPSESSWESVAESLELAASRAFPGSLFDRRGEALQQLAEYDERHRSQLLLTLEEYLRRRGNIATAATTLYVHPNTLRQRLRRIQDLTGLDVAREDWLMIEIELKLLRLERA